MQSVRFENIDEYLAAQPENVRTLLENVRQTVKAIVPEAREVISYNMPAFKLDKTFFYFAGFKKHYSFFVPSVADAFKEELPEYEIHKATIRIPFDKPMPETLLKKIVRAAVKHDAEQAKLKAKRKNKSE